MNDCVVVLSAGFKPKAAIKSPPICAFWYSWRITTGNCTGTRLVLVAVVAIVVVTVAVVPIMVAALVEVTVNVVVCGVTIREQPADISDVGIFFKSASLALQFN